MSIYGFRIPAPPEAVAPAAPIAGMPGAATPQSALGGALDQLIDPVTLDYVRTADGEWEETADSRTIVLIAIESELDGSPFFPGEGSVMKALLRGDGPITPEMLLAETQRVGRGLQLAGVLSELTAEIRDARGGALQDETGRAVVRLRWRDLASGSPVDLALQLDRGRI